jgi:hypothetical protein
MSLFAIKSVPETFSGFPGFVGLGKLLAVTMSIPPPKPPCGSTPSILQEAITKPLTAYTRIAFRVGAVAVW